MARDAMHDDREPRNLEQLLDRIEAAVHEDERIYFGEILKMIGRRSFGPLLLLAGLIAFAPVVGDIPGVPTIVGIFVVLISVQLLFHRDHFWLPQWMLKRSVAKERLCKALGWMRKPTRHVDRLLRPRLQMLVHRHGAYAVAVVCLLIGLTMPTMEVILLVANVAGAALIAFGLALIARDGLFALFAFLLSAATFGGMLYGLVAK